MSNDIQLARRIRGERVVMASLACWGASDLGQIGLETKENQASPQVLSFPGSGAVKAVACGDYHTLFLMEDGSVYSCGDNECLQLGRDGASVPPARINIFDTKRIAQLDCGNGHNLAVTDAGQVYAWGDNTSGQLGLGTDTAESELKPKLLPMISSMRVVQVACGGNHSVALVDTGRLYVWGLNNHGQLGLGDNKKIVPTPQYLSSIQGLPVRQVACGGEHTLIVSVSGSVYAWGRNQLGQLGLGHCQDCWYPTHCKSLRSQKIVSVAAGGSHSAALTKDGGVFTFGAGEQGQLGHNTYSDEFLPRKVFELMGSTVTHVACGSSHTLACVPSSSRIYSFGSSSSGQLGAGTFQSGQGQGQAVPQTVLISNTLRSNPKTWKIFAGGDHSVVLSTDKAGRSCGTLFVLSDQLITRISVLSPHDAPSKELLADIDKVFSNASCLNGSCLVKDDGHFNCTSHNSGVDLDEASRMFSSISLAANDSVNKKLIGTLSSSLFPSLSCSPPDIEAMRLYLLLPNCRLFDDAANYSEIICPFGAALMSLKDNAAKVMDNWWVQLQAERFLRLVEIYKKSVVFILKLPKPSFRYEVEMRQKHLFAAMEVLKKLNNVNVNRRAIVNYDAFYISELKDCIDVKTDYVNWIQQNRLGQMDDALLTFCSYPFVLDAVAKTTVLQTDALIQMQIAVDEVARYNFTSLFTRTIDPVSPLLLLYVTRDNIVGDTINQLTKYSSADFKKPLKVVFIGEEAMDAGGVKKEFFLLILKELLDPKYGMFQFHHDSHLIWFSEMTFEESDMYRLIGQLCGLAIYNSTIIALNFPLALYKKLLHQPVALDDLKELEPSVGRGMDELLEYEGDDFRDIFPLSFVVERELFGEVVAKSLVPGGENTEVTADNRKEYVDAYINYVFNESVKEQFGCFAAGFNKVIGGSVLNFFHSQELQAMVVGNENYDFSEFEKNTEYKGEYHKRHSTIRLFWEVFHQMSIDEKKDFLMFLTGSDRVPIVGMSAIKMTIQPCGERQDILPVAHTCFNILDLPKFTTKEKLREKVLKAIQHKSGFGLV